MCGMVGDKKSEDIDPLRVDIGGAFRLVVDGEEVAVTRPQVRTVLALLASSTEPVSTFELIGALWPDSVPANPGAAFRTIMSRTRTVLGAQAHLLVSNGDAFTLDAQSDWREVDELVAVADLAQDTVALASLLGRVNKLAFVGVLDSFEVDERRSRFAYRLERLDRQLLRLHIADGDDDAAVQLAQEILDANPGDESTACRGAEALARLGRKSQGITLLQQTREALVDRGLEPSPELVATEGAILRDAAELQPNSEDNSVLAPGNFVGRADQLDALARIAPGQTFYVEGEAGIGKSSLLGEHTDRCRSDGITIITAETNASAAAPMSVIRALVAALLELDGIEIGDEHRPSLAMLVPEQVDDVLAPTSREELIQGAVSFISESVDRSRAVLAIDDVQWLDHASILTVQALIASDCRLVLLARPGHSERILGDTATGVQRVNLDPLSPEETAEIVHVTGSALDASETKDLHFKSGGNPLFLKMLLDLLEQELDVGSSLPPVVLAAVQRRMEALSAIGRRVLQVASVMGTTFSEEIVAMIEPRASEGFIEAHSAGLVTRGRAGVASMFQHAVVADAAYQLLGDADRIALHDQIGRLLEGEGADPIEVFSHCRAAFSFDSLRASRQAVLAAQQHLEALDWEGAVETASWALGHVHPSHGHRLSIAKARGELALGVAGSHLRLVEGARRADAAGDGQALIEATIEICNSGSAALTGLDVEVVKELVDASLLAVEDGEELHELRAAAARAFVFSKYGAFGQGLYREAFVDYDDCDRRVQELILRNSEAGLSDPDDFGLVQRATMLLNQEAEQNPELRWLARWFQFRDALIDGDGDRLGWALRDIRGSANQVERRHTFVVLGKTFDMQMQQSWAEATMALIHDDFDLAEECAEHALQLGLEQLAVRNDGFGEAWVTASYGLLLLAIRHGQGRLAELVDVVETSAPLVPAWRVAIVIANHAAGNTERVRAELDALTANGFEALVPDPTWTAATFLLAEPVVEMCDPAVAVQLYDMISPFQERMSFSGLCTFGPMHEACAALCSALGKTELEKVHREQARVRVRRLQQRSRWAYEELVASK